MNNYSGDSIGEIWLIPFFGQGHLLPTMELCKHIASRNFIASLVISSDLSSTIPSSLRQYPRIQVLEIPQPPPPPPSSDPFHHLFGNHSHMEQAIQHFLSSRSISTLPLCAIVDVMMSWTAQIFNRFQIPIIGFFTSGACSAAMELALFKSPILHLNPGDVRLIPGLPENMAITASDLKRRPHGPGHGPPPSRSGGAEPPPPPTADRQSKIGPRKFGGPPKPGDHPPWLKETGDWIAIMINTCDVIEGPFIEYLTNQIEKPVWGVGPLLPEQYWKSGGGSIVHDHESRTNRRSTTISEEEVITWLDSKPRGSTLYVSFGSEVGPTMEEYPRLADALEASNRPFIWVIQPGAGRSGPPRATQAQDGEGYNADGLDKRVGERGLIIRGWAPQLLILSHGSTGGFLSHCGWNSSIEAIGRGVPILAWPIRGDQYYNAGLIIKHLKVGFMICDDVSQEITKDDIVNGIHKLLGDEEVRKRAGIVGGQVGEGFPLSSMASLDAFKDFIITNKTNYILD